MNVFVQNSQDIKQNIRDENALNLETFQAFICDSCSVKASVVKTTTGSRK